VTDNAIITTDADAPRAMSNLLPQNIGELSRLASSVAESKMFGARRKVNGRYEQVPYTRQEAFMLMVSGVELGLSPLQSVRELGMIDGRVDIPASVRSAKIAADPRTELWDVDSTPTYCTIIAKRRDRSNTLRVEIKLEDQSRASIAKHDGSAPGTSEHIEDWLLAKAVRKASRRYFPDFILGVQAPIWEPDEAQVIDVRAVEKEAGELELHHCPECGTGVMDLQANAKGGAFLRCRECNATMPPTDAERDVIRGRSEELSVAAVTEQREPEGENAQWALTAEEEAELNNHL
jgi:hypothetical protein